MPDVWIFDSSGIIDIRREIPDTRAAIRRELLARMAAMVDAGALCFPHQVYSELTAQPTDDVFAVWAKQVRRSIRRHYAPPEPIVREVLARQPLLADARKQTVDADPYVVAPGPRDSARWAKRRNRHPGLRRQVAAHNLDRDRVRRSGNRCSAHAAA